MSVAVTMRQLLAAAAAFLLATPLRAQCPDGTPPPCRADVRPSPPPTSVAVLYFDNLSRDTNDQYLADGLTEEIITRLSAIDRLTVRSRHLVRRFRGTPLHDPAAAGRILGVTYLVSGSVRRAGAELRVSAELVRASGGAQVWGNTFDQAGDDIFAIQEAVARQVAEGIVGRLLPSERRRLAARPTRRPAAHAAFLRGNYHLARRDSAGLVRALAEYETALRADPSYGDARARLALTYGLAYTNGTDIGLPADTVAARLARAAAEAVRRAPRSSDAWIATALARQAAEPRTFARVLEANERAVALDSTSSEAHHQLGFTLFVLGHDSAAMAQTRAALHLEPLRPVSLVRLAEHALAARDIPGAARWVDSALAVDRDFGLARYLRAVLLAWRGATDAALAEARTWQELPSLRLAAAYAQQILSVPRGDAVAVARLTQQVLATTPPVLPASTAAWMAMLPLAGPDAREAALALLERARPRGAVLRAYLGFALFDPIRGDQRFQRVVSESVP
jgi:TolB-like protein